MRGAGITRAILGSCATVPWPTHKRDEDQWGVKVDITRGELGG